MLVKLVDKKGPVDPLGKGVIAELIPYTNGITGFSDPHIKYANGFFVCLSTAEEKGWSVVDAETGIPIENAMLHGLDS